MTQPDHFAHAFAFLLPHEGGFADHPADPGGSTNFGVSLRYLKRLGDSDLDGVLDGDFDRDGDVDADDIHAMTEADAAAIYRRQWWDRYRYGEIQNADVAAKVLDLSVNMGPNAAHSLVQYALRAVHRRVKVDGILGPKTLAAVNVALPGTLVVALRSEAAGWYRSLVAEHHQFEPFLEGWLNRAYD